MPIAISSSDQTNYTLYTGIADLQAAINAGQNPDVVAQYQQQLAQLQTALVINLLSAPGPSQPNISYLNASTVLASLSVNT